MNNIIILSIISVMTIINLQAGDVLSGTSSTASGNKAVVSGGYKNHANGYISTIAGGREGSATGAYATVSGGFRNKVDGYMALIAGGEENHIRKFSRYNTISGGKENTLIGHYSVIPGGYSNAIQGNYSMAFGLNTDVVGDHSMALGDHINMAASHSVSMGKYISNEHNGSWVLGDGAGTTTNITDRTSEIENRFHAYFENGYKLYTTVDNSSASGVYLDAGDIVHGIV